MKRIFLALLAVAAMVACEKEHENTLGEKSKYDFAFDESGVCYSKNAAGVSHVEFSENVVGSCWVRNHWYEIYSDGTVAKTQYGMHNGILTPGFVSWAYYYFKDDSEIKTYSSRTHLPEGMDSGYSIGAYRFDNSAIYFGENTDAKYQILEIVDDEIVVIMRDTYSQGGDDGVKVRYFLTTLSRLSEERHQAMEEKYWRNWDEVE